VSHKFWSCFDFVII